MARGVMSNLKNQFLLCPAVNLTWLWLQTPLYIDNSRECLRNCLYICCCEFYKLKNANPKGGSEMKWFKFPLLFFLSCVLVISAFPQTKVKVLKYHHMQNYCWMRLAEIVPEITDRTVKSFRESHGLANPH